ncbi:MAG: lactate/malate family dehydrogenase [Deltaproteobacteria bacterium]
MEIETPKSCRFIERVRERDKIGVWGFGNVSRDVVLTLVDEGLGKEVVFYGRPTKEYPNRAGAWVEDLKANALRRPRLAGTNFLDDMAGLDVIFIGVGVPRKEGQSRRDLLAVNTEVIAETSRQIRELYEGCSPNNLPILVYMGNPVTAMTWVGFKVTGFPRETIMGQAGNLDTRRICLAVSQVLGISGTNMHGIVFGEHGDSMVAHPRYFSVSGIPLEDVIRVSGIDPQKIRQVMDEAKKGGTHFVNETGQSASAGPARAACDMLRPMIKGESEVQPVIAIIESEYGLIMKEDGLDSMSFGVPAKIGPDGVEQIYELPVQDIRGQLERSAAIIKEDIKGAAAILKEKYGIS